MTNLFPTSPSDLGAARRRGTRTPQASWRCRAKRTPGRFCGAGRAVRNTPGEGVNIIRFRASGAILERVDELAKAHGGNRSNAIRSLVLRATAPADQSAVPDENEVLVLLSESARSGSVAAMKELLRVHRERAGTADKSAVDRSMIDELGRRRAGRSAQHRGAGDKS